MILAVVGTILLNVLGAYAAVSSIYGGVINGATSQFDPSAVGQTQIQFAISFTDGSGSGTVTFDGLSWSVSVAPLGGASIFSRSGGLSSGSMGAGSYLEAFNLLNLEPGTMYVFSLSAVDHGVSFSSSFQAKTLPMPPTPKPCSLDKTNTWESSRCGHLGLDTNVAVSMQQFSCMKSSNYDYFIGRGWRSNAQFDTNLCSNLRNARAAGLEIAAENLQVAFDQRLPEAWGETTIWLDVEGDWTGVVKDNKKFYKEFVDTCLAIFPHCGVYTTNNFWKSIFGDIAYAYPQDDTGNNNALELWYAHYGLNGGYTDPNFNDFYMKRYNIPAWDRPTHKQLQENFPKCGVKWDRNWKW